MLLSSLSINKWVVISCFRYEVFTGRILLAALDHNFHVFRKTLEGRFKKIYSKRSGNWRVEPVKESKQYPHMSLLQADILRAAVCKYREFAVKTEISKFFIFSQKKLFGETFSKITIKASKEFSFSRKPAKSEMQPHAI